ncbi:MAG: hypothetical protein IJW82_02985 [Clostridia bacterium]|nr:hypothetical protein [Clostridia bacterium]
MAKKICVSCHKKIKEEEEVCPHCGYYYSNYGYHVDSEGRVYNPYQERMHNDHYEKYGVNNTTNSNIELNSDYFDSTKYVCKDTQAHSNNNTDKNNYQENYVSATSTDELMQAINDIYKVDKVGMIIARIFMSIWIIVSGIITFVSIMDMQIPGIIMSIIFLVIGVNVIKMSGNAHKKNNESLEFFRNGDYEGFIKFVNSETKGKKNNALLYSGSLVAYYRLNDGVKARTFLVKALDLAPNYILSCEKHFSAIIVDYKLQSQVEYAKMKARSSND